MKSPKRPCLNQRAFKRTAKEVSTWSQISFDSYNKASGRQTTLGKIILKCSMVSQPDLCLENGTLKASKHCMLGDEWRICQLHVETIPEDWYTEGERPTEANPSRSLRMSGCERKSLLSNEGSVDSSCSRTWQCRG